jgi:hypothetical protein
VSAADKAGPLQNPYVLAKPGKRHGKPACDRRDGGGPLGKTFDNGSSCWIGDGGQNGIQVRGPLILNHMV